MNIFKILANGDGTINEPNVSAFLGYLLNPYADHDLRFEFLIRFFENITEEDFNPLKYDFEILFEQAFREENETLKKKNIVDIVILCFKSNAGDNKESMVKTLLSNQPQLERVFLIENKIKKGALTKEQLLNQFISTKSSLNISEDIMYSIYVSPDENNFINEFNNESFKEKVRNRAHIFWKSKENENSISGILRDILKDEANAIIEPINEYTKQTIKAFIQFIENDFKSERQQQKERKNDGSYTEKYKKINRESQIELKLSTLRNELIKRDHYLNKLLSEPNVTSPRFPFIIAKLNDITIKIHAGASSRKTVSFLFQADKNLPGSKLSLKKISERLNIGIKKEKYDDAYCRNEEMHKQLLIEDYDTIFNKLKQLMDIAQNNS